jgi:glycerol kinase
MSARIVGAAVQWLRDGLGLIERAADVEALAGRVPSSDGVIFVPALAGLGAPYWDAEARGLVCGITRGTTAAHLARAALEAIAQQVTDLLEAMSEDLGRPLGKMRVDGGAGTHAGAHGSCAELTCRAAGRAGRPLGPTPSVFVLAEVVLERARAWP